MSATVSNSARRVRRGPRNTGPGLPTFGMPSAAHVDLRKAEAGAVSKSAAGGVKKVARRLGKAPRTLYGYFEGDDSNPMWRAYEFLAECEFPEKGVAWLERATIERRFRDMSVGGRRRLFCLYYGTVEPESDSAEDMQSARFALDGDLLALADAHQAQSDASLAFAALCRVMDEAGDPNPLIGVDGARGLS